MKKKIKKRILQFPSSNEKFKPEAAPKNPGSADRHCAGADAERNAWTHIVLKEIPTGFKDKQICHLVVKLLTCGWK